ncbi:transmembrane protease serine 9-like [Pelmatolapia mariae]|uniref:transmembrane protease serine 9-like n=1 Tax=Pelmatolapia mariae TaxID=158779 RepID=UPI002FE573C4
MVVFLGSNSLSDPNPNNVRLNVISATCHPGFNPSTRENDICLLKLSAPVNFTDYIQPICLASENSTFNSETSSWAIGFGDIERLILNLQEAKDKLGAPLMTQSKSVWVQNGVFNWPGCNVFPSVYIPVSQYQKWISDTVTGTPPGFVTFTSPHSSLQTTAPPTAPPTTPTAPPTSPTCEGVFCSGENLIHFTHFTSLCVLIVLLHVFAGTVGN